MTTLSIVMHISRTHRLPGQPSYKPASAVLLTEVGKLFCALLLAHREVRLLIQSERVAHRHNSWEKGGRFGMNGLAQQQQNERSLKSPEAADTEEGGVRVHLLREASSCEQERQDKEPSTHEILERMKTETFSPDWFKLAIPAALFTGQGNLSYYASSNLSVPIFMLTYQLSE